MSDRRLLESGSLLLLESTDETLLESSISPIPGNASGLPPSIFLTVPDGTAVNHVLTLHEETVSQTLSFNTLADHFRLFTSSLSLTQLSFLSISKSIFHTIGFDDDYSLLSYKLQSVIQSLSIDEVSFLNRVSSLSFLQSLPLTQSLINGQNVSQDLIDVIVFTDSFSPSVTYSRSFSSLLSFSSSFYPLYKKQFSFSDSLSFFLITNSHIRDTFDNTILHPFSLFDFVDYEKEVASKTLYIENFILPKATDIKIYPRFQPLPLPLSTYYHLDRSFLGRNYLNLVIMEFSSKLLLSTRFYLSSYLRSHDPEPYTIVIEDDVWRGFLVNDQPRAKYFTNGNVFFQFELEYLGTI